MTNESEPKSKKKKNSLTSETMKQSIEDEAWRSYLENDSVGLTIASSDEDTAGALATLYEYYKGKYRTERFLIYHILLRWERYSCGSDESGHVRSCG